ncbi:MAG TPA: aldose epimerase family protein [Paracoccaceae bacterium]|nr:aldose epimerase family protein [Paracoccaceae bacterium]HMO72108.1 aldose epimerase family protein [Paracoccaceae bacterium]
MDSGIFGHTSAGQTVAAVRLSAGDLTVRVIALGSILQSVRLAGVTHDLTLGADTIADYEKAMPFHGPIVGPVANRITGAAAVIAGRQHRFTPPGAMLLHSGDAGIHRQVWTLDGATADRAVLTLDLPDGAGGFPGNRRITAEWRVEAPATLRLRLRADTDAPTLMNLANHSYWNLDGTDTWSGHRLQVAAGRVLSHRPDGTVRGPVVPVGATPYDLRRGPVLRPGAPPFDHCYALADTRRSLTEVLEFTGRSGVTLHLSTTEPGVQVYDGRAARRPGRRPSEGMAFEPQFWPDAPGRPGFPSILLNPGQAWAQVSEWRFTR